MEFLKGIYVGKLTNTQFYIKPQNSKIFLESHCIENVQIF